jgi:adenylate cyclase
MALRKLSGLTQSILVALGAALVVSALYLTSFFDLAENRIYDMFLGGRPKRERLDQILFLDVDDQAIAHVGVFPWPRSVMAEGLLRLKEYGAKMTIFDIEYIDKSPTQVDEVFLKQGLKSRFDRSFSEIGLNLSDLLNALSSGQLKPSDAAQFGDDFSDLIEQERDALYTETLGITRNNDAFLSQAIALYGHVWGTLNLQDQTLEGEQAERRPRAEE